MTDSIIDRIKKLKALAERANGNEAEAMVAAAKMQELLMQHDLSLAEVDAKADKSKPQMDALRKKDAHSKAAMYQYQQDLMKSLAHNNFCQYWVEERFKPDPKGSRMREGVMGRIAKHHVLLGREDSVAVTQVMYDYLTETMDRLLPYQGMEKRGKNALLWLSGCTERLVERLNHLRWEKERETEKRAKEEAARGGAGLIRLSDLYSSEDELNDDFRYGDPPGTRAAQRRERQLVMKQRDEEIERLVANGMDRDDAWYVANGMEVPSKEAVIETVEKPETEAQRRKRLEKEQRERDRWREQSHRGFAKAQAKRNTEAYRQGSAKANDIGLDSQIGSRKVGHIA